MIDSRYGNTDLSLVSVVNGLEADGWSQVRSGIPSLTEWGIKLLRSRLDGHMRTTLIEPHYICKDYRNLFSHFYSKKFIGRSSWASRLHFFSENIELEQAVYAPEEIAEYYIGYSVVEPILDRCLGRTVLDPYRIGFSQDAFCCLRTKFDIHLNGARFFVKGFPYRSQSAEATVCAHTALWCCCRYLSERYSAYADVFPYDLIEMTGDTEGRRVPYRGMQYKDYSSILSQIGTHPAVLQPRNNRYIDPHTRKISADWRRDTKAFYDFYSYVESGFPILTSFDGHVVNVIGHTAKKTLDTNDAPEKYEFYNSACLVDKYIVMDDNFSPYQLLGYVGDHNNYGEAYTELSHFPCIDSIAAAVVPLPEKAFLLPVRAREICYEWFNAPDARAQLKQIRTDLKMPAGEKLIARTFLTSANAFKKRKTDQALKSAPNRDLLSLHPVTITLPHFIWVMELSPLSLHNTGACIGEVVLDASASRTEPAIYGRIGSLLHFGDQKQIVQGATMHYSQYTHNLGERNP